jgi:hypothetical protein
MPETPDFPDELPLAEVAAVIAEATASAPECETPESTETAYVPEATKEHAPMIDIHDAHHAASTWKEFFIHIATIVLGLIIAVGLEQGVEYIHHRRELAEARRELAIERKININHFSVETEEFHRFIPILENNLAIFVYLRQHPGKPVPPSLGTLRWHLVGFGMLDSAWTAAQHSGVVDYMPQSEARKDDELYRRLDRLTLAVHDASAADVECARFRIAGPDPAHLSPAQLDQEIDLVSKALSANRAMANIMINANGAFPDFTPAPSRSDYEAITYSQTVSADDRHDIDATHAEGKTVTDYERSLDQNEEPQ